MKQRKKGGEGEDPIDTYLNLIKNDPKYELISTSLGQLKEEDLKRKQNGTIGNDRNADLKFIKAMILLAKRFSGNEIQNRFLDYMNMNLYYLKTFITDINNSYNPQSPNDKEVKELINRLNDYKTTYGELDVNDIIKENMLGFSLPQIPIARSSEQYGNMTSEQIQNEFKAQEQRGKAPEQGGSSKVTFYKKVDGKTKKYTRVIQLNKRGTKCVKCDGKLVPISKLKKTP